MSVAASHPIPRPAGGVPPAAIKEIARGGTGAVELAFRRESSFRRMYAVKRLYGDRHQDERARSAFLREARLAGNLRHPNIVSVLDVGLDERGPFIVMDFVFGLSLRELTDLLTSRQVQIPMQLALRIAVSMGHALWAAHDLATEHSPFGLIHSDVSPSNVLVGFDGVVRLVDFGLARGMLDTSSGDLLQGTSGYISPEQLQFEPIDARSDLFSLGVLLYELITGERLYGDADVRRAARRILGEPPPDLRDVDSEVPEGVAELVRSLLAKSPEDRPNSSAAVVRMLEEEIRGLVVAEGPVDFLEFLESNLGDEIARRRLELASLWERYELKLATSAEETPHLRQEPLSGQRAIDTSKVAAVEGEAPARRLRPAVFGLGLAGAAFVIGASLTRVLAPGEAAAGAPALPTPARAFDPPADVEPRMEIPEAGIEVEPSEEEQKGQSRISMRVRSPRVRRARARARAMRARARAMRAQPRPTMTSMQAPTKSVAGMRLWMW